MRLRCHSHAYSVNVRQLAPKPRAAKQIELDENLKPRNKAEQSAGREGVARASKRR